MENYSVLFPCSSSSVSSSHNYNEVFQGDDGNLGLGFAIPEVNKDVSHESKNFFGSENSDEKAGKKKGEKKVKKPRFAFQTRSQVDILDDGYRWRKYGQKAVKNNKFPRSYYRCTHQGCNVKKQVQRLSKDEGVVVTTYEGMHSHPIQKSTDNFEHILSQMQIYSTAF
ncbi:hypothetical protein NMG60_11030937 [Bertholletia excelsa]